MLFNWILGGQQKHLKFKMGNQGQAWKGNSYFFNSAHMTESSTSFFAYTHCKDGDWGLVRVIIACLILHD